MHITFTISSGATAEQLSRTQPLSTFLNRFHLDEFGVDLEDECRKKLVVCERTIRRLHAVGETLPDSERFPFKADIGTLLSKRLPIQERWIASTERFLPEALKRVAARKSCGQQAITAFFKRKSVDQLEDIVGRVVAESGVT